MQLTCQIGYHFITLRKNPAMVNSLKNSQSHIYNAILKHGHSNFSLTILEYCFPDKCLEREKYYWELLNPEYNIAKEPGAPMYGRKHSEETKQILSDVNKEKTLSEKTKKKKISDAMIGNTNKKDKQKSSGSGRPSQQIEVTDIKNNQTTTYDSIRAAARALNIYKSRILKYFSNNQQNPYKGQYTFKSCN